MIHMSKLSISIQPSIAKRSECSGFLTADIVNMCSELFSEFVCMCFTVLNTRLYLRKKFQITVPVRNTPGGRRGAAAPLEENMVRNNVQLVKADWNFLDFRCLYGTEHDAGGITFFSSPYLLESLGCW